MDHVGIRLQDCVEGLKALPDGSAQIVLCDPPYNIGKEFGNNSDRQEFGAYIKWCVEWMRECLRVLRDDGTLYIYGFSEILAHLQVAVQTPECNLGVRWLVWHYTNKNIPSYKFWQRSHESILCIWKNANTKPHFNRDDVREPYTETFLKNAAGKTRKATAGRFSNGQKETTYTAHDKGALPRDVLKCPALAGGAGKKERVNHPTQKPLELCLRLLKAARKEPYQECVVVVPFGGSGSECVAAQSLGMPFVAFEINPTYVALIEERLLAVGDADVGDL